MIAARPPVRRSTAGGTAGASWLATAAPILLTAVPAVGACLVAAAVVGGASPLLLARAATRVLLDLSAATVLGSLAIVLLLRHDGRQHRSLDVAASAAGVWTIAAATTAFLLYLGQATAISSPAFGPGLVSFLSDVVLGRTWLIATVAAAVLTTALVAVRSHRGLQLVALLAVGALVPVAAQSAPSDQSLAGTRTVGAAALVVLVAVGTWIGVAAVVAGSSGSRDGRGGLRVAGLTLACGASAAVGLTLGGVQRLPLGIAVGGVLLLALGAAAAGLIAHRRAPLLLQLVLLGTAAGLTAAARVVQSTPAAGARTTPAEILTGAPRPGVPTVHRLLVGGQPDAVWVLIGAGLLVAYLGRVVRLRRAGTHWPARRAVSWSAGALLLVWLTCGGPAVYAPVLLSAHLAQHAAVTTVVPLLLAAGAPLRLWTGSGPGATAGLRGVGALGRPIAVAALAAGAFLVLYGTDLLRWSVTDAVGTEWGLLQCLLTGALVVGALRQARRRTALLVALGLLLVETLAAAVLATSPGLLLADRFGAMGWGTDALADQRLGAVIAGAITVLATLVLLGAAGRPRSDAAAPRADLPAGPAPRLEVPA